MSSARKKGARAHRGKRPASEAADYRQTLERAKRASPAQLLMRAARLVNERGIARVREGGWPGVRSSHMALLPHIDLEGTRITEIARRMKVTKQAVNQAIGDMERFGMVRRAPDPSDARAKLVLFTVKGRRELLAGLGLLRELEEELAGEIGSRRMKRLRDDLEVLVESLERD